MRRIIGTLGGIAVAAGAAAAGLRMADRGADAAEIARILATQPPVPALFRHAMVADLPEPAARFLRFAIAEGTPLRTVADIRMEGLFSLGEEQIPQYRRMSARQVLGIPEGFVWVMRTEGFPFISGSDSGRWTRFWAAGLVPVARMGGSPDHARAAFGRAVSEAVFWTPAAVLPGPGVLWTEAGPDTARVTVTAGALSQEVEVRVDAEGRPLEVDFLRWSDANPEGVFKLQPFGGYLSDFEQFGGFRLPTHVEAGNQFGTPDYFPFFIADITDIRFPERAPDR